MKHNILNKVAKTLVVSSLLVAQSSLLTSCNDWLDLKPNNERVTEDYWKCKEDVEEVVASGYYYMRTMVPTLIKWGELRGGAMYSTNVQNAYLQNFQMTASNSLCSWDELYKVMNNANSVIKYAPGVQSLDNTYYNSVLNSHISEAYFQRAFCNLVLLKNYKEAPIINEPYVDDSYSFNVEKSSDTAIVAQIKADVKAALATGAAKGTYESNWQTKGRATKWALYAVMADVCLWNEDYSECIKYCDEILNATDAFRPVFISDATKWYEIFYPGNSNESIFELNWDYSVNQQNNNFSTSLFPQSSGAALQFTKQSIAMMRNETQKLIDAGYTTDGRMGRMLLATYVPGDGTTSSWATAPNLFLWKYYGNEIDNIEGGARANQDANFIIYRVAEIIMMKAQAEAMLGNYKQAIELINKIRIRAGLSNYRDIDTEADDADTQISQLSEQDILEEILDQKEMEFMGEAKRWYDLLWLGRVKNNKYKTLFINKVIEGVQTTKPAWVQSTLLDNNSWYLPIPQKNIDNNTLLKQNPYYATTK